MCKRKRQAFLEIIRSEILRKMFNRPKMCKRKRRAFLGIIRSIEICSITILRKKLNRSFVL
jgi:hypothetical protein